MAQEIERKFLLKNDGWRKTIYKSHPYIQGYLSLDPDRVVRIRIVDTQGILTIKGKRVGISCSEFEYPIPYKDARQMLSMCIQPLVKKIRHMVIFGNLIWEVDEFLDRNDGLIVVEVELDSEDQEFEVPPWLGEEVSHDKKYANACLVTNPFCNWEK